MSYLYYVPSHVLYVVCYDDNVSEMNILSKERNISNLVVSSCVSNSFLNHAFPDAFMRQTEWTRDDDSVPRALSGSSAEFYISPALSCIGDVDVMVSFKDNIAVFNVLEVNNLPGADIQETTKVSQIITLNEKWSCGYYYLRLLGNLRFNWEQERFNYYRNYFSDELYYCNLTESGGRGYRKGPAIVFKVESNGLIPTVDLVICMRCFEWPPIAQSWLVRKRNHTWPCKIIIHDVQRIGCDFVNVSHRDHAEDFYQWRLSFSRAEVILIRSWTRNQQIVYHMLKYFAKVLISQLGSEKENWLVRTYHIKTLMLWSCERESPDWWKSNCVLVICSKLLATLMEWIMKLSCPHYFIPEWNLFDHKMAESSYDETIETLGVYTNSCNITEWFRENYVSNIFSRFVSDSRFSLIQKVLNDVALSECENNKSYYKLLQKVMLGERMKSEISQERISTVDNYLIFHWKTRNFIKLIAPDRYLSGSQQFKNVALALLRLAWNISRKEDNELSNHEFVEVLHTLVFRLSSGEHANKTRPTIPLKHCSKWYFLRGNELLSIYCTKHSDAYYIWLKTCKRYFKSALSTQDEFSESIHDESRLYLAALYYVSWKSHAKAVEHCMMVKPESSFNHQHKSNTLINSTVFFVDDIANIYGFYLVYIHCLRKQHTFSEIGFTLNSFAFCLMFLLMNSNQSRSLTVSYFYKKVTMRLNCDSFLGYCLVAVYSHKNRDPRTYTFAPNSSINDDRLLLSPDDTLQQLLLKLSAEYFARYLKKRYVAMRDSMEQECSCEIVSHFKALYHYKNQEYTKALNICNTVISQESCLRELHASNNSSIATFKRTHIEFPPIPVVLTFQILFGIEVTCLTGLIMIIDPKPFTWDTSDKVQQKFEDEILKVRKTSVQSGIMNEEMEKYIHGKLRGYQHLPNSSVISPLFLVFYLRFKSMIQLNHPKSEILSALNVLEQVKNGFVFEDVLLMFMKRTLEKFRRFQLFKDN